MADIRYFVFTGEGSYRKLSSDKGMYVFTNGKPVAVAVRNDQYKFAGNPSFVETDKSGKELDFQSGALPGVQSSISYAKLEAKGAAKAAPVAEKVAEKEDEPEPKKDSKEKKDKKKEDKKKEDK